MTNRVIKGWKNPSLFLLPDCSFVKNSCGANRQYAIVDDIQFRDDAFAAFGFYDIYTEPLFKNFIGNQYGEGAFTHEHRDPAPQGFVHARANWMVKKPMSGGNPVINGIELSVDAGDLWLCLASEENHWSTQIHGGDRLVCSFGALIKRGRYDLKGFYDGIPRN